MQPDPAKRGGLTEALTIATLATTADRVLTPHCWGSGIALAACMQLLAATPSSPLGHADPQLQYLELDQGHNPLRDGVLVDPFTAHDGVVDVPAGAGLGVEVDQEWIAAHAVSHITVTSTDTVRGER